MDRIEGFEKQYHELVNAALKLRGILDACRVASFYPQDFESNADALTAICGSLEAGTDVLDDISEAAAEMEQHYNRLAARCESRPVATA